jgi:nucleotide-binding universal stress UspA family protein
LDRQASDRLKEIVAGLSGKRGDITIEIVYGKRVEEVLRFVREHEIDLIVLASHPVDRSQAYGGLGTMSYKLGILAPCAVLLVK